MPPKTEASGGMSFLPRKARANSYGPAERQGGGIAPLVCREEPAVDTKAETDGELISREPLPACQNADGECGGGAGAFLDREVVIGDVRGHIEAAQRLAARVEPHLRVHSVSGEPRECRYLHPSSHRDGVREGMIIGKVVEDFLQGLCFFL